MKINKIIRDIPLDYNPFSQLKDGELFFIGSKTYMKIYSSFPEDQYNAINLQLGIPENISDTTLVTTLETVSITNSQIPQVK